MSITIKMAPPLQKDIDESAGREGITVADHAALLLLIGRAVTREGRATPFGGAVAGVLASRSLDVDRFASAMDDLVRLCVHPEIQDDESESGATSHDDRPMARTRGDDQTLRRWRQLAVQLSPGAALPMDTSLDAVVVEVPPSEHLIQPSVRQGRVSALGKFAHLPGGSEEFARLKQLEIDLEDRHFS